MKISLINNFDANKSKFFFQFILYKFTYKIIVTKQTITRAFIYI